MRGRRTSRTRLARRSPRASTACSERLAEYRELGARFTKWRAVITIGEDIPSEYCVWTNAHALARYAALSQEAGLVPIVEPEVLMDGDHTIERSFDVTSRTLHATFTELRDQRVRFEGMLLKPNMVLSGYACPTQASVDEVAAQTLLCFERHVPAAVPGIVFLSGGQSDEDATVAPERDERQRAARVGALVLVRPRAPGAGAQGVGRRRGERRGGTGGVPAPSTDERPRAIRRLLAGAREACSGVATERARRGRRPWPPRARSRAAWSSLTASGSRATPSRRRRHRRSARRSASCRP